jgi:hypothetical protein
MKQCVTLIIDKHSFLINVLYIINTCVYTVPCVTTEGFNVEVAAPLYIFYSYKQIDVLYI